MDVNMKKQCQGNDEAQIHAQKMLADLIENLSIKTVVYLLWNMPIM